MLKFMELIKKIRHIEPIPLNSKPSYVPIKCWLCFKTPLFQGEMKENLHW